MASDAAARKSSTSARGYVFMALLALQFGLQPIFTKEYVDRSADKIALVLACEALKFLLAVLLLVTEGGAPGRQALRDWRLSESLLSGFVPAAIYAVQNVCIQIGYQNTSGLLFNLLNQTKIIFTAVMVYLVVGKAQSYVQMLALTMVLGVGVVLSLPGAQQAGDGAASSTEGNEFWLGIVPTLAAAVLSGFASAWSQRVMQTGGRRHAYLFSAELSFYSCTCLVGNILAAGASPVGRLRALLADQPNAWIPLCTNAVGGIFVGQVIKHANSVSKSFSVIFGIMLTGLAEFALYGVTLSPTTLACLPVVVVALYLYAVNPPLFRAKTD